jgi:hypothetical protein
LVSDLPHTLTNAILYRAKIDSFAELPKEKQPPRNLWDKPGALRKYLDTIWDKDFKTKKSSSDYVEFNLDDAE